MDDVFFFLQPGSSSADGEPRSHSPEIVCTPTRPSFVASSRFPFPPRCRHHHHPTPTAGAAPLRLLPLRSPMRTDAPSAARKRSSSVSSATTWPRTWRASSGLESPPSAARAHNAVCPTLRRATVVRLPNRSENSRYAREMSLRTDDADRPVLVVLSHAFRRHVHHPYDRAGVDSISRRRPAVRSDGTPAGGRRRSSLPRGVVTPRYDKVSHRGGGLCQGAVQDGHASAIGHACTRPARARGIHLRGIHRDSAPMPTPV